MAEERNKLMSGRINWVSAGMLILFYVIVVAFGAFMTFYVVPVFGG